MPVIRRQFMTSANLSQFLQVFCSQRIRAHYPPELQPQQNLPELLFHRSR